MHLNPCRSTHGEHVRMYSYMYVHMRPVRIHLLVHGVSAYMCVHGVYVYVQCVHTSTYTYT